jgi:hypothetical protein
MEHAEHNPDVENEIPLDDSEENSYDSPRD